MEKMIRIENNKIQIMDLLRSFSLFDNDDIRETISPSKFAKEMQLTVEQRLKVLNDRSRRQKIGHPNKLWAIPDLVVFQNFEPHVSYSTTISFMHQKQYPVRIKVTADLSPCYQIHELPGTVYSKLAPGTPHKLILDFYSEDQRDYLSYIRFEAEDDMIYLPIVALAPRPLVIFPDIIELPKTVVNIASEQRAFIRNSAKSNVIFKIQTEAPFFVCPKSGILQPEGVLDVKISYKTCRVENSSSELVISFDGVKLSTKLLCQAKNCEIYLDKTILYFEDTFIHLQRSISLNLINNSGYSMKYQWKQFDSKYIEMEKCKEYRLKLKDMDEFEILRNIQNENPNITDAELHETFINRIYKDELAEFDSSDQFLFHHKNFSFQETTGTIGPYSTVNIEVIFAPDEVQSCEIHAYLDVTGRETRQPLKMIGNGLGPEVTLNCRILDVENLYLCAKHQYEIVAKNEGIIPATLKFCHKTLDFGGSMECRPTEINIEPGNCEKLVLQFSSTVQGKFLEYFNFKIAESSECIGLIFQGNVVCPLLNYDLDQLDFGDIAFGFVVEKELSIHNTTEVPIEFKIKVFNDGMAEAITWVNFSMNHDSLSMNTLPKEFSIYPEEATVAGNSSINIKLTLVPNLVGKRSTLLQTYMWGSTKHFVELPIYYNCVVPEIECTPSKIDIRYCFINCPYDREFAIKNISAVPGYLLYNDIEQDFGLTCNLSLTESFIEPGEEIIIHLEIKGLELGLHTKYLNFTLFGQDPVDFCKLTCDVQGPVICVNPEDIIFGEVELLKWHSRKLYVMNDSPVSASISISLSNEIFHFNPTEFKLEASEKLDVEVSVYLTNVGKYKSICILNIVNSCDPIKVQITAVGVGCCVLFEPVLTPAYDLGTLMTHNFFKVPFKMTNMGKEQQKLYFSNLKQLRSLKVDIPTLKDFPFIIEPHQFELQTQETETAFIEMYNTFAGPAELVYYCYSMDKTSKFTQIFGVKLTAYFEDPILSLSHPTLNFKMEVTVDDVIADIKEMFTVTNDTYLALDIFVSVNTPFYLVDETNNRLSVINENIPSKAGSSFWVEFDPPTGEKRCTVSTGTMKIGFKFHPRVFLVPLTGEVHFPTIYTYPESIINQHIAPMASCSKQLIIKNISPLTVVYKYEWEVTSYTIKKLPTPRWNFSPARSSICSGSAATRSIPTKEDEAADMESQFILENLFNDSDTMTLPDLDKIQDILLNYTKFQHLQPATRRRMVRLCNMILANIVGSAEDKETEYPKILENMSEAVQDINVAMLNVTPSQGCLEPYECTLVNFYIRPPPQTYIKATVICHILGGDEEKIEISGLCGDISVDIDKTEIELGNQLFCEVIEAQVTLNNIGHVAVDFVIADDTNSQRQRNVDIQWLTVGPNMGSVEAGESTTLEVKYFPGTVGEFNESFTIEIEYLGPVIVNLHGFGVYPQLSINLPRPNLVEEADFFSCYTAISNLTKEDFNLHLFTKCVPDGSELDDVATVILQRDGWVIVELRDADVPSEVDIAMSIERQIGYFYLQNNPQFLGEQSSFRKKNFTIPNYIVPAYDFAFGNVRLDGEYEREISLYNYGPGICTLRLSFIDAKAFAIKGFSAKLSTTKILPFESSYITIVFKPDNGQFDSKKSDISEEIFVEVYQGAKIPILITASVGIPSIELSAKCMDFCGVIVGECKRKTLCLFNCGFVETKWTSSIDSSLFFTRKNEGLIKAGDTEDLHIFFEPRTKGPKEAIIIFTVEGNEVKFPAILNGFGIESRFIVKEKRITFAPVLQYSPPLEETCFIQNISSFPNELFFSDLDRQIELHERICQVFWTVKNAKKVYVAKSCYGNTSSDVYKILFKQLLLDRRQRHYSQAMKTAGSEIRESKSSMERVLDFIETAGERLSLRKRILQDIFIDGEFEENKPKEERDTKIIVFYGNKYTDFLKAANVASIKLDIRRYTIDGLIVKSLVQNNSTYAKEVNQIIQEAYQSRMEDGDCLCRMSPIEDATDEMYRRLEVILGSKPIAKKSKHSTKKEEKEKSDKSDKMSASSKVSKKGMPSNSPETFQGIPEEKIVKILSDSLDQFDRLILEGLDSIFLPNVQVALRCLLKAANKLSCVYFVFLTCDYEQHSSLDSQEKARLHAIEIERRQLLRKKILETNEVSDLHKDSSEILRKIHEERRAEYYERKMALRMKIQDGLIQNNRNNKATDLKQLWAQIDKHGPQTIITVKPAHRVPHAYSATNLPDDVVPKEAKEAKESKSPKRKKSPKNKKKSPKPTDEESFYFSKFDIILSEMLHLLEYWDRRSLEMTKPFPNFASLSASNKKAHVQQSIQSMKRTSRGRSGSTTVSTPPENTDNLKNVATNTFDLNMGYPVWVVNQAHYKARLDLIDPITNLLGKMFRINCLTPPERVCSDVEVIYSVVKKPANRKPRQLSDVFELIKSEATPEGKLDVSAIEEEKSSSSGSAPSKKKLKKRKLTLNSTPSEIELMNKVPVRFVMEPGQIQAITLQFKPLYCGDFKFLYNFEVVGTSCKKAIEVLASCDYPRIDTSPYAMFSEQVEDAESRTTFSNGVFILSQKTLDFGTVLLIPQHLLQMHSTISILNISTMLCEISLSFKRGTKIFFCHEDQITNTIPPGRQLTLSLYAKPRSEGIFRDTLLISIKHNPTILEVLLTCHACPLKLEILPKYINFNKVILGKTESEKVYFKNHTSVMVRFELEFDISSEFEISSFNGYLEPSSIFELRVDFTPTTTGDLKESITVKIFDKEKQHPEPVHMEDLILFADVATFPMKYSTSVDLGLVKGKIPHFFPFTINNTGHYDVKIIMTKPTEERDPNHICNYFKIKHMDYVVKGDSKYLNNCRFLCNKDVEFKNQPVAHVTVLDNYRNSVIDSFNFTASAKVTLSKFELCPYGEYFFGYQNVNTVRSSILTLKNTGSFDFKYTILTPEIIEEQAKKKVTKKEGTVSPSEHRVSSIPSIDDHEQGTERTKSPEKVSKTPPGSRRKRKMKTKSKSAIKLIEDLTAGIFTITPSTGKVEPGETVSITIRSAPKACEKYTAKTIVFVSEPGSIDRKGRKLNLHVNGTEPCVSFDDYKFMFPEQFVVKNIQDLPYVGENTVFEIENQLLNFGKVALYSSVETRLRIPNTGHVTANVHFEVTDKPNVFSVGAKVINIAPYTSEFNSIQFRPKTIGLWKGILSIKCSGFSSKHILSHDIYLVGEACMPSVELVEPKLTKIDGTDQINFPPLLVDRSAEQNIVLRNNGRIPCRVRVEVRGDPQKCLSFTIQKENGIDSLEIKKSDKCSMRFKDSIYLNPGEKGVINLKFQSLGPIDLKAELKISVVNNCFDVIKLPIMAHCFLEPISLEGLPISIDKQQCIMYSLNFGPVNKNEQNKRFFKIRNSSESVYKFELAQMPGVVFSPNVGHLNGNSTKTIMGCFITANHVKLEEEKLPINITQIQLFTDNTTALPWDDRQDCKIAQAILSDESIAMKAVDTKIELLSTKDDNLESGEPLYNTISATITVPLLISAVCDHSKYFCGTKELIFPQIHLYTESKKKILVENRSNVYLKLQWELTNPSKLNMKAQESTPSIFDKMQDKTLPLGESLLRSDKNDSQYNIVLLEEAFTIDPNQCSIPPKDEQEFDISFHPTKNILHECMLKANMQNLDTQTPDLEIKLKGEIRESTYHFKSPHIEKIKRSDSRLKNFCGHIVGENAKILHFVSLSAGTECNRTISIINETTVPLTFMWQKIKTESEKTSFFHCEFNKGCIFPAKQVQTTFVFLPQSRGNFTSIFDFIPDDPNLPKSSVLMQGVCREPRIYFEHPFLSLGTAILNNSMEKSIILRNDEDVKLHFKFKKNTLYSSDQQILLVSPFTGLMDGNSRNEIRFSSKCIKSGETIFSPKCSIQGMSEPIQINVITNVIEIDAEVYYYDKEENRIQARPSVTNVIDLGVIIAHRKEEIRFELQNLGKFGFYYAWTTEDKQSKSRIIFTQQKGYITASNFLHMSAFVSAMRKCKFKNIFLKLQVLYGPSFSFLIEASADKPLYTFSFLKYSFGKCTIQQGPSKYYNTSLIFTNYNKWPVMLQNGSNDTPEFLIDFLSAEVNLNKSAKIDIFFSPTQVKVYETRISFLVNSDKVLIKLSGEGVPLALDVLSLSDKFVDFGAVRVGKTVQKTIRIINAGEAATEVFFDLFDRLPFHRKAVEKERKEFSVEKPIALHQASSVQIRKKGKFTENDFKSTKLTKDEDQLIKTNSKDNSIRNGSKKMNDKVSHSFVKPIDRPQVDSEILLVPKQEEVDKFLLESLEISPKKFVKLTPGKTVDLVLKFKPLKCIDPFQSNIFFEAANYWEPILTVMGAAIDANFRLNKDVINFGNVVIGYSNEQTVILMNEGCFGGHFKWSLEKSSSYVSFVTDEGYSPPKSNVTTTIIFKPGHVQCVYRLKAYCKIDNYSKRLELLLTGGSMNYPHPIDTLRFAAAIRDEASKEVHFKNETKEVWKTKPVFSGNFFSGPDYLIVQRESSSPYKITYAPTKLSDTSHKGTVFFSLPSGFSRLYSLEGIATAPKPIKEISREINCKTYHTEVFNIENWLGLRQQFKVISEVIEGDSTKMIYKITSNNYMEVPPFGKRNFKWTIYVMNEGKLSLKVTFLNEKSKEYVYYIVSLKIIPSDEIMESIDLTTCVRIPVTKKILIRNPLDEPLDYTTVITAPYIFVENMFTVPPYGKYELAVKYYPVKEESTNVHLQILNTQVGTCTYNLNLRAHAPSLEPEVLFKACLGLNESEIIYLPRLLRNCDVNTKIPDNTAFTVVKIINQTEKPYVKVNFSPFDIGTTRGTLQISSSYGEYTYPLIGESLPPEPQGPIRIGLGDTVTIDFTNPFEKTKNFQFNVDDNFFQVKPTSETLRAKSYTKIFVTSQMKRINASRKGTANTAAMAEIDTIGYVTAKLTVSCEHQKSPLKWIYYLQCKPNK